MSERPPMMMIRKGATLRPLAGPDYDALAKLPSDKPLKVKATQPRSVGRLRLYFTMLDLVAENLDQAIDGDALHEWLKLRMGLATPVRQRNGETMWVPRSVAFDKMEEAEFAAYFDQAVTLLIEHIIPGLNRADLEREARAMLGIAA